MDDLVRIWENTDAPDGGKVELVEGIVTVTPPPEGSDNLIANDLQRSLYALLPEDMAIVRTQASGSPGHGTTRIPDLALAPREEIHAAGGLAPFALTESVIEITSRPNARHDRTKKAEEYAAAGAPSYLLIDWWATGGPTITLYGEPGRGGYRLLSAAQFGEKSALPAPFDFTLDSGRFLPAQ